MTLARSVFQPNAGWGVICEYCKHRDRIDLARNSFPCTKVTWWQAHRGTGFSTPYMPNLTRRGADGGKFGHDFQEDCSDYQYNGVS